MKVFITGDSHTGAIRRAQQLLQAKGGWPVNLELTVLPLGGGHLLPKPFFEENNGIAEIVEKEYRKRIPRLPLDTDISGDTIYGVCAPFHSARLWRSLAWKNFAPSGIERDEAPVSRTLLKYSILDDQKYVLALLDLLVKSGRRVFVIEAPYPFQHHQAFERTRPEVILAVNQMYRSVIREELRQRSIPVVALPRECVDVDGFMKKQYRHEIEKDQHHGNEAFGKLMMQQILTFLDHPPLD